jgi:glycosyltransferase involved in cell wall biosynthesis
MSQSEIDINHSESFTKDICIIIPTYNNEKTIARVIRQTLLFPYQVIVVNDGCTDQTSQLLSEFKDDIIIISNPTNRGKGVALKKGLLEAQSLGFRYAITLDADGQHYPEDIPLFVDALQTHPDTLIIGSRILRDKNMSKNSTFANRFSNFWFYVQTGKRLPDTQTGFRLYPLSKMKYLKLLTAKYEAELELLVFSSWHGIELLPIHIRVFYPSKEERVSHFRPFMDFARISMLNTALCVAAIIYGMPLRILRFCRRIVK